MSLIQMALAVAAAVTACAFAELFAAGATSCDLSALPAFGKKHFEIPFNAEGQAWVRFAVWDSAGNGAVVQSVRLTSVATTAQVGLR
jgi:hypothetical protein